MASRSVAASREERGSARWSPATERHVVSLHTLLELLCLGGSHVRAAETRGPWALKKKSFLNLIAENDSVTVRGRCESIVLRGRLGAISWKLTLENFRISGLLCLTLFTFSGGSSLEQTGQRN